MVGRRVDWRGQECFRMPLVDRAMPKVPWNEVADGAFEAQNIERNDVKYVL